MGGSGSAECRTAQAQGQDGCVRRTEAKVVRSMRRPAVRIWGRLSSLERGSSPRYSVVGQFERQCRGKTKGRRGKAREKREKPERGQKNGRKEEKRLYSVGTKRKLRRLAHLRPPDTKEEQRQRATGRGTEQSGASAEATTEQVSPHLVPFFCAVDGQLIFLFSLGFYFYDSPVAAHWKEHDPEDYQRHYCGPYTTSMDASSLSIHLVY
ncbi:hypothetical protein BJY00DRAFT_81702 [Aspergillus carlsbadensis]|nr:hypothetical protein BJY00DRAFT_81702 [Aspergillus carlsbadensis]